MSDPDLNVKFVPHIVGDRFFTVPELGETIGGPELRAHLIRQDEKQVRKRAEKVTRYAAYIRISSEEQVGNFSVDAQRRAIETWVKAQSGHLVKVYTDEAQSGRTADRPEFQNMRRDAKNRLFDAIVVHKFDRFARNRTDALAIKSLLRQEYGVKVYSVSEPSEDSDGPIGALIEGIMESVADWYSRNLSTETAKGKREKALQGYHNNRPPFGMDKTKKGVLSKNEQEFPGLLLAFEFYATTRYSDNDIAHELNDRGYRSKSGKPFSTETVRDMLQNRTYLGYVKYQPYARRSDGRRSYTGEIEWHKGKHEAIIPAELFEKCQEIRRAKATHHEYYPKHRVYLLRDIIFCAECVANMPTDTVDPAYGKMRAHSNSGYNHYRCRARDFGRKCPQGGTRADGIEEQVVTLLKTLKPPADWRENMVASLGQLLGDKQLEDRIAEIKTIIERMDFRWDHGFITDQDAYLQERVKLQQELEQLTPIPDDDLDRAADMLANFPKHWEATKGDRTQQEQLIKLIVARVWVKGDRVVAISLRPNYHVTVGLKSEKPTEFSVDFSDCNIVLNRERRGSITRWLRPYPTKNRVSAGGQGALGCSLRLVQPENLIIVVVWRLIDVRPQRLA